MYGIYEVLCPLHAFLSFFRLHWYRSYLEERRASVESKERDKTSEDVASFKPSKGESASGTRARCGGGNEEALPQELG
jgi:hypothetical protein